MLGPVGVENNLFNERNEVVPPFENRSHAVERCCVSGVDLVGPRVVIAK